MMYPCAGADNNACIFHIPDETFVRYLEEALTDGQRLEEAGK